MMFMDEKKVKMLKDRYPSGTVVVCDEMTDPWSPVKSGTKGKVMFVDDIGTIHVSWESGSTLGLVYGEDKFHIVSE